MEIRIPRIDRAKPVKTILSKEKRAALFQLAQSSGYLVLLEIMEMACVLQDNELISVEPEEEKKIIAEQHIAVAKWGFFDYVQKQVAQEINELVNGQEVDTRTAEEIERHETLNP